MARSPSSEDLGRVQLQSRGVVQGPRDAIGPAVARLGNTIGQEADATTRAQLSLRRKRKSEDDSLDLARATADWQTRVIQERERYSYDKDQDYGTWGKRFGENTQKHREASASLIRDPHTKQLFLTRTQDDAVRHEAELTGKAEEIDLGKRQSEALESVDKILMAATRPGVSKETAARAIMDARASIDNMAKTGLLTPEAAAKKRIEFTRRYAGIQTQRDIERDPSAVSKHLGGEGGDGYYRKLKRKESGGNLTAKNPNSTATGPAQFTEGTWKSLMARHPELGLTANGRTDPYQSDRALRVFTEENREALQGAGIPVSEKSLYLAHFLGAGGAIKAWNAPPDMPADRVLPEAAKANKEVFYNQDGSPKSMAEVIANQTRSFAGDIGPAPGYYEFLDPTDRIQLASAADAEWARRDKAARDRDDIDRFNLKNTIEDDIAQIENTGVATQIDPQTVVDTLGETETAKWLENRKTAAATFEATSSMESMSDVEIDDHLEALEPKPGASDFAMRQKVFDAAERRAKKLQGLRLKDPAGSVEDHTIVKEARKSYDPENPASVQNLTRARLAAQEAVGIPSAMQQPIDSKEARQIIAPIQSTIDLMDAAIVASLAEGKGDGQSRRLAAKQVRAEAEKTIKETVDTIEATYGPYAGKVLAFAIAESVRDKQIGEIASSVLRKIAKGQQPSLSDAQDLDAAQDTATASKAIEGGLPAPAPTAPRAPAAAPAKGASAAPAAPTRGTAAKTGPGGKLGADFPYPSRRAVEYLISHPNQAAQFDQTYGPGAAESWLR